MTRELSDSPTNPANFTLFNISPAHFYDFALEGLRSPRPVPAKDFAVTAQVSGVRGWEWGLGGLRRGLQLRAPPLLGQSCQVVCPDPPARARSLGRLAWRALSPLCRGRALALQQSPRPPAARPTPLPSPPTISPSPLSSSLLAVAVSPASESPPSGSQSVRVRVRPSLSQSESDSESVRDRVGPSPGPSEFESVSPSSIQPSSSPDWDSDGAVAAPAGPAPRHRR